MPEGGIWATGCKCLPISDASHFETVARYIRGHAEKGAAVWESELPESGSGLGFFDPQSLLLE